MRNFLKKPLVYLLATMLVMPTWVVTGMMGATHAKAGSLPKLMITEFVSNPNSGDKEWVELTNTTGFPVDLTGWTISDASNTVKSLSALGTIRSKGVTVYTDGSSWLNNTTPETISVYDSANTLIDTLSYNNGQLEGPSQGKADSLIAGVWVKDQSPTKGIYLPSANITLTDTGSNALTSVNTGESTIVNLNVASLSGVANDVNFRYRATITKDGVALPNQVINYNEAGQSEFESSITTDENGIVWFGPATGINLTMLPALATETGISTPFQINLAEAGDYGIKIEIVNLKDSSSVAADAFDFNAASPSANITLTDTGSNALTSVNTGESTIVNLNVASLSGVANDVNFRYRATITKDGVALPNQVINYNEAGQSEFESSITTDENGIVWFGPATGINLTMLPALATETGISTPFQINLAEAGDYGIKIEIVKLDDESVIAEKDFQLQASTKVELVAPVITSTSINGKTITVTWDKVPGADGYHVYIVNETKGFASDTNYDLKSEFVSDLSFTTSLPGYGNYSIIVYAEDLVGNIAKSEIKLISVNAPVVNVVNEVTTIEASSETTVAAPVTVGPTKVQAAASAENSVQAQTDDQNGKIKGDESSNSDNNDNKINWTPWIVLFVLIILAGAATGGYFYWFAGEDEVKTVVKEEKKAVRKVVEEKKAPQAKPKPAKKSKRW